MKTLKPTNPESPFGTAAKVFDVCKAMQDIEDRRALDRAKINVLFNGGKPYTPEEEKKYQIQINVNWGLGPKIMQDANRQLNNALVHQGRLFNCTLEAGRPDKRDKYSAIVTEELHKPLQRGMSGLRHSFLLRQRNATVALHGIGALLWPNDFRWLSRFVALEDLLISTDTYSDFTNLRYFGVNLYPTPGEFVDMTKGELSDPGWNQEMVNALLDAAITQTQDSMPSTWRDQPEAMLEVFKQNKGYYYSDAVPKLRLRAFYYQEPKSQKWYRCIIAREGMDRIDLDKFVYQSDAVFADEVTQILNVQYGDSSLVAPFKYHSVRGLGVPLFAPVETLNRMNCEFIQHVFEQLKMYFRANNPADRDRLKQVVLAAYGFIPEGLSIVPRDQRHQIDANLVESALGQMRQFAQENSSSYVQDVEKSTGGPITAREATIRINQANQMVGGMLQTVYFQENFYYQEIFRRFCGSNSNDPAVKKFQDSVVRRGVPKELLKSEYWNVLTERVLGSGDASIAQLQSQWLMEQRPKFNPDAQTIILRLATSTMLNDPAKAELLVPEEPVVATSGTYAAENVFATLMQGIECKPRKGIDEIGYVEALLEMMEAVIVKIQGTDNVGTIDDIIGLQNVARDIGTHLMTMQANEEEKSRVKDYSDMLGQMMNEVKGFAQRYMEQKQKEAEEAQRDPEGEAKAQSTIMLAQAKIQLDQQKAASDQRIKQLAFQLDEARKKMDAVSSLQIDQLKAQQEIFNERMRTASQLMAQEKLNAVKIAGMKAATDEKIRQMKAQPRPEDSE